jgi:hypothetical protein
MPETIAIDIGPGVASFYWNGAGTVRVHLQFVNRREAIEAFDRLRFEVETVLYALSAELDPRDDVQSTRFQTERPAAPPGSGLPGLVASVMNDPRLVARQRPVNPSEEMNYSKLPPRAALSVAQKIAEEQVAAYARAQGRTTPGEFEEPIVLPQAKPVPMKAEIKAPTHEEALKEAAEFVERQKAAMAGKPWPPVEENQILPPPPPPESEEAIADAMAKSS